MKKHLIFFSLGIAGGILGSLVTAVLFNKNYVDTNSNLEALIAPKTVINRIEQKISATDREALFAAVVDKGYQNIVAVQSFVGGKMLRFGSGLIMTQDGLVVTLNSVVPPSAGFFQVFVGDRIDKAKVVSRDYQNNLALIELTENDLVPADFVSESPKLGSDLIILGKHNDVQGSHEFALPAFVFESAAGNIKLLTTYDGATYGAVVFDRNGHIAGILDWQQNSPKVISVAAIKKIFDEYLASQN